VATPIHDIASLVTISLRGQAIGIEHVLLPAVPEFIGALAATLVSAVVTWAFQKWRRRGTPEIVDDDMPS
jgi:hypothetical protein